MSLQSKEFPDGVAVVAIDLSAPYVSGIRRGCCRRRGSSGPLHLVMFGKLLTDVRLRVQHEQQGRARYEGRPGSGAPPGLCCVPATSWARKPCPG